MIPKAPLRFEPLFRPYLWGGRRLQEILGKKIPPEGIWAESWELVDHGNDQSFISQGALKGTSLGELVRRSPRDMLGSGAMAGQGFPLLLKYLDCRRVLSVQVHPNDEYAAKMDPPDLGKTEAWYVVAADPGSLIYAGLKPGVDRETLEAAIRDGRTESCLQTLEPKVGDCVFIPAGTVHALGAGLVVAEIQQASDTTFRLFDWNRVGDDGKPRPLHVEQALEVINYDQSDISFAKRKESNLGYGRLLVDCDKFRFLELTESSRISPNGGFVIVTIARGAAKLQADDVTEILQLGETVLVPAAASDFELLLEDDSIALIVLPPA
jgi:mannose-6-phosphate isomerase